MKNLVIVFIIIFNILSVNKTAFAHEPLYGQGPHVLYKGGFAPGIVFNSGNGFIENEFELHYGLTSNWTIGAAVPFSNEEETFAVENYIIKSKYRFYTDFSPGSMTQVAAYGGYMFSNSSTGINALLLGVTAGREAIDWYWFASADYTAKFTNSSLKPGNELNYHFTLGYRPFEVSYYEPDLVVFLELLGKYQQKSSLNDNIIGNTDENAWAAAPTFMLTYRNYAIRGGVEFGLANSGYIEKPETNFKIGFEVHL